MCVIERERETCLLGATKMYDTFEAFELAGIEATATQAAQLAAFFEPWLKAAERAS